MRLASGGNQTKIAKPTSLGFFRQSGANGGNKSKQSNRYRGIVDRKLTAIDEKRAETNRQVIFLKLGGEQNIVEFSTQNRDVGQPGRGGRDARADDDAADPCGITRGKNGRQHKKEIERGYALYGKQKDQHQSAAPLGARG